MPSSRWNTLPVTFKDNVFGVYLNGEHLFDAEDQTFGEAGKVVLWTKADSVTQLRGFHLFEAMRSKEGVFMKQFLVAAAIVGLSVVASAQSMPADYDGVLKTIGKTVDYKRNVLKVNVPRTDLKVTIDGIATLTAFGFGGWVAMTKGDAGNDVMMGDLVLLEDEVNPVMSALLSNGLEVTALHNHFFFESPRIFYMHVQGHGKAADLARMVKRVLDLIGEGNPQHQSTVTGGQSAVTADAMDTAKIARVVGH